LLLDKSAKISSQGDKREVDLEEWHRRKDEIKERKNKKLMTIQTEFIFVRVKSELAQC